MLGMFRLFPRDVSLWGMVQRRSVNKCRNASLSHSRASLFSKSVNCWNSESRQTIHNTPNVKARTVPELLGQLTLERKFPLYAQYTQGTKAMSSAHANESPLFLNIIKHLRIFAKLSSLHQTCSSQLRMNFRFVHDYIWRTCRRRWKTSIARV